MNLFITICMLPLGVIVLYGIFAEIIGIGHSSVTREYWQYPFMFLLVGLLIAFGLNSIYNIFHVNKIIEIETPPGFEKNKQLMGEVIKSKRKYIITKRESNFIELSYRELSKKLRIFKPSEFYVRLLIEEDQILFNLTALSSGSGGWFHDYGTSKKQIAEWKKEITSKMNYC